MKITIAIIVATLFPSVVGLTIIILWRLSQKKKAEKEKKIYQEFAEKHKTNCSTLLRNYYIPMNTTKEMIDEMLEQRKYIPLNKLEEYDEGLDELKIVYQKKLDDYLYQKHLTDLEKDSI